MGRPTSPLEEQLCMDESNKIKNLNPKIEGKNTNM